MHAYCDIPAEDSYTGPGVILALINDTSFNYRYKVCQVTLMPIQVTISVTYPAFTHNVAKWHDSAIKQTCDIKMVTSEANVMTRFYKVQPIDLIKQDELDVMSGGSLVNITFPEDLTVYNQLENPGYQPSSKIYVCILI